LLEKNSNSEIKKQIKSLVFDKEFLEACNWCNGRDYNVAQVDAAIQTKKPLEYKEII